MLERTNENMSEPRRNAIRRKSKPKQTAGSSGEECPGSSGEWSGQVKADSPLMGFSSCQTSKTLDRFVSRVILSAFWVFLRNFFFFKEHSFEICGSSFFFQPGNIRNGNMWQNLYRLTHYSLFLLVYRRIIKPWTHGLYLQNICIFDFLY